MDIHSLDRFVEAQERMYHIALAEVREGEKRSHWMWYIFPQLRGLGKSAMSYTYGIADLEEARAYLAHPVLSARLTELCEALLALDKARPEDIFGYVDAKKLHSSMTLFALADQENPIFGRVLARFYAGGRDGKTLALLGKV